VLLIVASFLSGSPASAGPTRYDPKTRSFNITYTYAALPQYGMSFDQVEALG